MEWKTLATVALGLAAAALGALVPATASIAFPAAGALIGLAMPHPASWRKRPEGEERKP